jgi:hypothetical protein
VSFYRPSRLYFCFCVCIASVFSLSLLLLIEALRSKDVAMGVDLSSVGCFFDAYTLYSLHLYIVQILPSPSFSRRQLWIMAPSWRERSTSRGPSQLLPERTLTAEWRATTSPPLTTHHISHPPTTMSGSTLIYLLPVGRFNVIFSSRS